MSRTSSTAITTTATTTDFFTSMAPEEQARRYKALLKSHKQLEARIRQEARENEWWKERVIVLDNRCRDLAEKLGAALDDKRALTRTVGLLKVEVGHLWRCRLSDTNKDENASEADLDAFLTEAERDMGAEKASWALEKWMGSENPQSTNTKVVDSATQTESREDVEKDLAIKALIQTLWNAQSESAIVSAKGATCECDSARALRALFPRSNGRGRAIGEDPLAAMLFRRRARGTRSRSTSLEERGGAPTSVGRVSVAASTTTTSNTDHTTTKSTSRKSGASTGAALLIEAPPHPHPEVFSKARKERKHALKMKLKATREMVDGLRRENGVLEGLLGSEGGKPREDLMDERKG